MILTVSPIEIRLSPSVIHTVLDVSFKVFLILLCCEDKVVRKLMKY